MNEDKPLHEITLWSEDELHIVYQGTFETIRVNVGCIKWEWFSL